MTRWWRRGRLELRRNEQPHPAANDAHLWGEVELVCAGVLGPPFPVAFTRRQIDEAAERAQRNPEDKPEWMG